MSQDIVVQIFRELLRTGLLMVAPILIVSIVVGLTVGIFQAATQVHEMTLVFVPKILAVSACLLILFPWLLNIITTYTINLYSNIPVYVR